MAGFIEPGSTQYLDKGPKGPGLYGNATILKKNREEVASWVDTPFGLSIHASGELERPGDITSKVTRIDKVHSVDLVVRPGAGGAIVEVLESELLSVPTWNSYPLEPGYILSPLQESEDMLIRVPSLFEADGEKKGNWAQRHPNWTGTGAGVAAGTAASAGVAALSRRRFRRRGATAAGLIKAGGARSAAETGGGLAAGIGTAAALKRSSGGKAHRKENQPMLNLKYQLYEDDSSGNQYIYLGNDSEQGFAEAAAERWAEAMGDDMKESDEEPTIFKDPQGNHFALLNNSEHQEAGGALVLRKAGAAVGRSTGVATRGGGGSSGSGGGGGMGGRLRGMIGRNKGKIAAGAAVGGAGVAAGRMSKRKESEEEYVEGEVYEQDGQFFQFLGDASALREMDDEDDEKEKKDDMKGDDKKESNAEVMEAIGNLQAQIAEMRDGPQKAQEVAEAANEATAGSYGTRRLIEQAAVAWAGNAEEATVIGKTIGQIIEAEREALAKEFGFAGRSHSRWQGEQPMQGNPGAGQQQLQEAQPYVGGAGAFASGGGNLQETSLEKFDAQLDKLLEGVM